jgi:hypothetical protein
MMHLTSNLPMLLAFNQRGQLVAIVLDIAVAEPAAIAIDEMSLCQTPTNMAILQRFPQLQSNSPNSPLLGFLCFEREMVQDVSSEVGPHVLPYLQIFLVFLDGSCCSFEIQTQVLST